MYGYVCTCIVRFNHSPFWGSEAAQKYREKVTVIPESFAEDPDAMLHGDVVGQKLAALQLVLPMLDAVFTAKLLPLAYAGFSCSPGFGATGALTLQHPPVERLGLAKLALAPELCRAAGRRRARQQPTFARMRRLRCRHWE